MKEVLEEVHGSFSSLLMLLGMMVFTGFLVAQQDDVYFAVNSFKTRAFEAKEFAKVAEVVDGDTIKLEDGRVVRYIGMDAPEDGECMSRSAKRFNADLVAGQTVTLEADQDGKDDYERDLRYVWVGEILVNQKLVSEGLAKSTPIAPNLKYNARIYEAHLAAKQADMGLWGVCD